MRRVGLAPHLLAVLAGACGSGARVLTVPPPDLDDPAARASHVAPALHGHRAAYVITFRGERIGEAREKFYALDDTDTVFRFEREERIVVRRDGAQVVSGTRILVDTDVTLTARAILVERTAGTVRARAEAGRLQDGSWSIVVGGEAPRIVDGAAVPSMLVPLLVASSGTAPGRAFHGPVLLEGSNLALAELTVDVSADRREAVATLRTGAGEVLARTELDERGFVLAAGSREGVGSRRTTEEELARSFEPPEIVASSAVVVEGGGHRDHPGPVRLRITGVRAPVPSLPELEHQKVALVEAGTWDVRLEPPAPTPGLRAVRERVEWVSRALEDDLGAFAMAPEEALAVGRGDCTAHAIVLKKALEDRGYAARLVTGFVLDQGALRRHRWVLVEVDRRWIPVDPMFGEAPASAAHLALAVHGSSPGELAFIDDVAFAGWDFAHARLTR